MTSLSRDILTVFIWLSILIAVAGPVVLMGVMLP